MWSIAIFPVLATLVIWTWQFFNWAWFRPRRIERFLRAQGMKGSTYKFMYGDAKETSLMFDKAYSKPIGLKDDIVPRIMPNILDTVQKYGDFSFSWSGPRPRIYVMDPGVARDMLNNYRLFRKYFKISNQTVKLLVTGLVSLEGDEWTRARNKVKHAFSVDKLKPMVPAIQSCCVNIINEWKEMATKEGGSCVIDAFHRLEILTGSVLAQLMFSSVYTEEIKHTFLQLAELAILAKLPSKIFTMPGEEFLPTHTNRRSKEIDKYVRRSVTSMINERLKRKGGGPSADDHRDLLDIMIEDLYGDKVTKESERQKIIENAIGECRIFFFAGFETSSNLLTWAVVTLAYHQDWQTRAREEVFRVLGDKKEITSDDLTELKIITMIVNEMLRLYPPIMELTRLVSEDIKINGCTIPKDSLVTFPTLMYHRSKEIWGEDVLEFNPERFAEGVLKAANGKAAYQPFGWGPRICIGMNFALLEAKTFLTLLLRNFAFELSPTYIHAPVVAFTIQPQYGAHIVLRKL